MNIISYSISNIKKIFNFNFINSYFKYFFIFIISGIILDASISSINFSPNYLFLEVFLKLTVFIFSILLPLMYRTILIENLLLDNFHNSLKIKEIKKLFKKSINIFKNELCSSFLILLGILCFIIPGIVIFKRHLFVGIISVDENLGIKNTLRLSRKIAEIKGWSIISTFIISYIFAFLIFLPIGLFLFLLGGIFSASEATVIDLTNLVAQIYFLWVYLNLNTIFLIPLYKKFK